MAKYALHIMQCQIEEGRLMVMLRQVCAGDSSDNIVGQSTRQEARSKILA